MIKRISPYIFLFSAAYLFFLSMLAGNFSASHDSINYLNEIAKGVHLFHPHHLLYNSLAWAWVQFLTLFLPFVPTHLLAEAFTAIWGSAVIVMVYAFFRNRFSLSQIPSISGAAIVGCSFGVWFYSVNVEVYMPPIFFILLALYIISRNDLSRRDIFAISILHSLAVLFHQVNILFAVVVFYRIWKDRQLFSFKKLAIYIIPAIVIIGGAYYYIGTEVEGHRTFAGLIRWMQGYTVGHGYWQPLSIHTPLKVATGFFHAFIGGHFLFAIPFLKNYFSNSFVEHRLSDEFFLSRHISPATAWMLLILTILFAFCVMIMIIRFVKRWKSIKAEYGNVVMPIVICFAVYSVFFFFWMPEILEFWILQSVLLWLLLLGTNKIVGLPWKLSSYTFFPALGILIAVINYAGSIRWLLSEDYDLYYSRVQPIQNVAGEKDLVLMSEPWIMKDYVSYFTKADTAAVPTTEDLRKMMDDRINSIMAGGGKVYIYPEKNGTAGSQTSYLDSLIIAHPQKRKVNAGDVTIWVIE
jgi:hypothetical protein